MKIWVLSHFVEAQPGIEGLETGISDVLGAYSDAERALDALRRYIGAEAYARYEVDRDPNRDVVWINPTDDDDAEYLLEAWVLDAPAR